MARKKPFKKPTDIKQWWEAPHCGPGSTDPDETCGFCGLTNRECAEKASEVVRQGKRISYQDDTGAGDKTPDGKEVCFGSGWWCSCCGRFWAQDSCGESNLGEEHSSDGAKLRVEDDGTVYCVCGQYVGVQQYED